MDMSHNFAFRVLYNLLFLLQLRVGIWELEQKSHNYRKDERKTNAQWGALYFVARKEKKIASVS